MKRGYLYIAVTTLLFSSMEVALKLISGQFNPIQLNFSRFIVGGLVLIPFAVRELKKRGRKLDGKALGSFALLAFLVLHEAIPGNMLGGIACILCGSLVSILPGLLAQRRAAALPVTEGTVKEEVKV